MSKVVETHKSSSSRRAPSALLATVATGILMVAATFCDIF
jgi:hypothetical protein